MDPILKEVVRTVRTPGGGFQKVRYQALGGLHYIKGNSSPHFSLTYSEEVRTGQGWSMRGAGADHEAILKRWPSLKDLAALHLSDKDGQPMHVKANGWYWLAGFLGGMGEEYHGGQDRKPEECLQIFADLVRVSLDSARGLARKFREGSDKGANRRARTRFGKWCDKQGPRWAAEAAACITAHGLKVYGDAWPETRKGA